MITTTQPPAQLDLRAVEAQTSSSSKSIQDKMQASGFVQDDSQSEALSRPNESLCLSQQKMATKTTTISKPIEKSIIIHKDENGFGLRIKGQAPVYIEHVHEGGAAWRAGVRALDSICKVNGIPVKHLDHKDVVLMFKSCSRFVALTLISPEHVLASNNNCYATTLSDQVAGAGAVATIATSMISNSPHQRQYSIYTSRRHLDHDRLVLGSNNSVVAAAAAAYSGIDTSTPMFGLDSSSQLDSSSVSLTSSLLFVDRNKSFKSASDQIRHLALQQLHHQRLGRVTSSSQLDSSPSSRSASATKLNRRDSTDESGSNNLTGGGSGDKRLAICTSCQQEQQQQQQFKTMSGATSEPIGATTCGQCKLKLTTITARSGGGEEQHGQKLHMSLRAAKLDNQQQQQQHHHQLETSASEQNLALNDKSSMFRAKSRRKAAAASPLVSTNLPTPLVAAAKCDGLASRVELMQVQPSAPQPKPKVVVNRRIEIIREFIDTERTHTERLRCLDELFYRPLKQANFMNGEQLRMVFSCHRTLYKIHRQIYRILLSANYDFYSEPLIGSALLEIFEGDLKRRLERASCSFCSAQATNIELLNKITRRDTKPGEFLAQVTSQRMIGRLGIKDLLASCFQRLTKYPLLLENLLKATPQVVPHDDDDDNDDDEDDEDYDDDDDDDDDVDDGRDEDEGQTNVNDKGGGDNNYDCDDKDYDQDEYNYCVKGNNSGNCSNSDCVVDAKRVSQINEVRLLALPASTRNRNSACGRGGQRSVSDDECGAGRGGGNSNGDYDDDDNNGDYDNDNGGGKHYFRRARRARLGAAAEEARLNTRRMLAISLAEEREFIERALYQSRQILVRVNESIRVAMSRLRLKEIWKRTDKYPGVPLIDITKQQVIHEGALTLRLSKRSFDVYMLLLNDYIIILTREGQDKYRLKFFTPEGKSAAAAAAAASASSSALSLGISTNMGSGSGSGGSGSGMSATASGSLMAGSAGATTGGAGGGGGAGLSNLTAPHQTVYSPVFVIDEHLTTRDAATDENGFYLLCKRKDDSRIYEFASRSPAERLKWRDKIQWAIERQMSRHTRRPSCGSILTKSSSEISACGASGGGGGAGEIEPAANHDGRSANATTTTTRADCQKNHSESSKGPQQAEAAASPQSSTSSSQRCSATTPTSSGEPTKIVGTISYVIDDGIVMPSKMESSRVFVDQAIQVNILDGTTTTTSTTNATAKASDCAGSRLTVAS